MDKLTPEKTVVNNTPPALTPELCKQVEEKVLQSNLHGIRIIKSSYTGTGPIIVSSDLVGEVSGVSLHDALTKFFMLVLNPPTENAVPAEQFGG